MNIRVSKIRNYNVGQVRVIFISTRTIMTQYKTHTEYGHAQRVRLRFVFRYRSKRNN